MNDHAVVIAGGGPTGLMLAGELALAGVDAVIVERRVDQQVDGSRAGGLHARTIEVLDQRGIAERFLSEGTTHPFVGYAGTFLDISDFPTRHKYLLGLWQSRIEPILAGWVEELGVPTLRGREVVGFAQDEHGVDIGLSAGAPLRARYLVGCDGGRSLIRKAAGIGFPGWEPSTSWIIAEVEMDDEPQVGMRPEGGGIGPVDPGGGGPFRVVLVEQHLETPVNPPWPTSARRSSPPTGRTSWCTALPGSPGSPTPAGRRRPIVRGGCCSPATPHTCTAPPAGRASTPACRMR